MKPAVFLDRDGTVIEHVHHLTDPADVKLIPGAAAAIRALRSAGYACVVVTNQSVIGRGMLTVEGLERVHKEMIRQLAKRRTELDGIHFCPVVTRTCDRTIVEHLDRKPGPGMLLHAARELDLDLSRSWMIGDMLSDTHAGRNARCRGTILIRTGRGPAAERGDPSVDFVAGGLTDAAQMIIQCDGLRQRGPGVPSKQVDQRCPWPQ